MTIKTNPVNKPEPDAIEIIEKRDKYSKTFKLQDGRIVCRNDVSNVVHYLSEEDRLRTCDTAVQEHEGRIFVDWLPYKFELIADKIGFKFESRYGGKIEIYLKDIGVGFSVPKPLIENNKITFENVVKDLDIVFLILTNKVKTLRILKSSEAPRIFEWEAVIDSESEDKIDSNLTGTDANYNELDLSCEILKTDKISFIERWSGKTKIRDPITRIKSLSDDVLYPVEIDPTVNNEITDNAYDGYEVPQFGWNSNQIRMGRVFAYSQHPGWTFFNVNVPQAAVIDSATLSFTHIAGNYTDGIAYGRAIDNSTVFDNSVRPSNVTKTSASQSVISSNGSVNITSIVQEIVNRAGWVPGNAMSILILGISGNSIIKDYSAGGSGFGTISITYTASPAGSLVSILKRNPSGFKRLGL